MSYLSLELDSLRVLRFFSGGGGGCFPLAPLAPWW